MITKKSKLELLEIIKYIICLANVDLLLKSGRELSMLDVNFFRSINCLEACHSRGDLSLYLSVFSILFDLNGRSCIKTNSQLSSVQSTRIFYGRMTCFGNITQKSALKASLLFTIYQHVFDISQQLLTYINISQSHLRQVAFESSHSQLDLVY